MLVSAVQKDNCMHANVDVHFLLFASLYLFSKSACIHVDVACDVCARGLLVHPFGEPSWLLLAFGFIARGSRRYTHLVYMTTATW